MFLIEFIIELDVIDVFEQIVKGVYGYSCFLCNKNYQLDIEYIIEVYWVFDVDLIQVFVYLKSRVMILSCIFCMYSIESRKCVNLGWKIEEIICYSIVIIEFVELVLEILR